MCSVIIFSSTFPIVFSNVMGRYALDFVQGCNRAGRAGHGSGQGSFGSSQEVGSTRTIRAAPRLDSNGSGRVRLASPSCVMHKSAQGHTPQWLGATLMWNKERTKDHDREFREQINSRYIAYSWTWKNLTFVLFDLSHPCGP
jgi:hypothetical protein